MIYTLYTFYTAKPKLYSRSSRTTRKVTFG